MRHFLNWGLSLIGTVPNWENGGEENNKMNEKTMVNDILDGVKASLTTYQGVISETENMRVKTNHSANT